MNCLQRSRIAVLIASVFLFDVCFPVIAVSKDVSSNKRQIKSAEVSSLLRLFMSQTSPFDDAIPWDTGSKGELPITWGHAGIKDCEKDIERWSGSLFCRVGEVVLTIQGKITHKVLGIQLEPGRWSVTMVGSRAGGKYVLINSDVSSQELEPNFTRLIGRQLPLTLIQKCGGSSDGSTLYRALVAGKKPMFVIEGASCGSGGCAIKLMLGSGEDDMRRQMRSSC